ncbi:hypothetical protein RclHR1_01980016 [Rhizophagus clarus]|uniref:Protein kinase domain-containing protein n=1 Tax=Rhizophagus clarus TaxID=94130 RepID=A0A2Z6R5F2_9GLOM|nr:hypothetical protein RclHR1_01980016 [Rhizophagus clarus]
MISIINEYYGISQHPITLNFMIITVYYKSGDLIHYITNNFFSITWKEKLKYLGDIIYGLYKLHRANIIHKDLHSGNIFIDNLTLFKSAAISDLGLSKSSLDNNNDEIYGIIPYVAPEVLQGQKYTKASDVYSFGKRGIDNQIKDDNNDTVIRSLENENTDYLTKELKFDIEENKNSSGSRLPGKLSLTFNPFSVQDDIYYVESKYNDIMLNFAKNSGQIVLCQACK